jgi:hypothetical protein
MRQGPPATGRQASVNFAMGRLGPESGSALLPRLARHSILLRTDLDEHERSVSLYHEVLEAATVAADHPPESVVEFNEGAFERAAQATHARSRIASPESLNQMLAEFGF